jgi:hypothetical protein
MKNRYSVVYKPEFHGHTYDIRVDGRWIYSGWTNGSRRAAERAASDAIVKLQSQQKVAA